MHRREGLADALAETACRCCDAPYDRQSRRFRCTDCGVFVQCLECLRSRHALTPLHPPKLMSRWQQEWKGTYWLQSSLQSVGCVYQLGHGGHPCPRPAPAVRKMVVMDATFIHNVNYQYCGCDSSDHALNLEQLLRNDWWPATTTDPATCATFASLDLFRLLNVVANVNVHDFVGMLERQTDATGGNDVPDRYKAFGRMTREYAFALRVKRAGRAYDPAGLENTADGECAVLCWACPQDGKNIPEGWRDVAPEFRFLYMLLLAMDANFRLKSRLRANQREDLPLGAGWGHLLNEEPYKEHLKGYITEKDVSTCIAFAALLQKDTRMTTGLRCSGVGGVVCARHELVRPLGIGDLQKGERLYANMDYILLSAVLGITTLYLAISYDIACQWQVNLPARMEKMPEHLRLDLSKTTVTFGLPVWHASAHEKTCQAQNSLTYMVGAGRTDGEGIERTWSVLNPMAWSTKEMGPGARHDAMEDRIDHHNFEKNIGQVTALPRKLIVAIAERDIQVAAFQEVDRTLQPVLKQAWQEKIDNWVRDRTLPNPYELEGVVGGPTEAAIRLALTKEEAAEAASGGTKLHGSSVTSFIVAGLQLEETQRRIRAEAKGRTLLVADHSAKLAEMRMTFFKKLRAFRRLQAVYMPAAVKQLGLDEDVRDSELPAPKAEDVRLYLPSSLCQAVREEGCTKGLPRMEAKLREGQCRDALVRLRSLLHAKRHLILYRDTNVVGQRAATRAHTLIERLGERIDAIAGKYRRGREALVALRGGAECHEWKDLADTDIQLDEEREVDAKARKKLGSIGSKSWRRQGPAMSSKNKRLSWIWTAGGGPGEDEGELHDSVRVEWSKALARKCRWEEEVRLLREEMKRVLRFLRWRALWWEAKQGARGGQVSVELRAGLDGYAGRQAYIHRDLARRFKTAWDTSAATVVRTALREEVLNENLEDFGINTVQADDWVREVVGTRGDGLGTLG
ncbi:hypothetical protein B0H15DRAFT_793030 [Mycena belliarum]|uniref:CxC2-like cysteine cluster KDZ transposase-associated domain-containing protein n=1 Tax=Mycena belliarum TaxID=1033014 RepID=A0AAD6TPJ4_9AGAR|nr:hypothetical protein B0H15DRAFT_793030 [Mycena belliae]